MASPGGVAERSESFKMMIAGGNHTVIKKLLSVARLMRGGDRLDYERSWVNGICFSFRYSTYCCRDFKLSPPLISQPCRFRKAVMADSFPPGEAKGKLRKLTPFSVPICSEGWREATSLPYRTQKLLVFERVVTGRVREPMYWYQPKAAL